MVRRMENLMAEVSGKCMSGGWRILMAEVFR